MDTPDDAAPTGPLDTMASPAPAPGPVRTSPPYGPDDLAPVEPTGAPATPRPAPPSPAPRTPRRAVVAALVAVALGAGATGAVVTRALDGDRAPAGGGAGSPAASAPSGPSRQLRGEALDVAGVVAAAGPSVVSIQVALGRPGATGAGSGVILTGDGEVLTNAHVVEGASRVFVTVAGESRAREADVVGRDAAADLALLRIPGASGLPAAALGDSASVAVGDDVVAIGNALALRGGPTVTRGIVSGLDRSLQTDEATITGLIQTDASISSGNSGGPLVDSTGRVIGINTAVATSGRGSAAENIGFAIAVDQARPVIERLRGNTTAMATGFLGISSTDPADGSRGATIVSVEPGTAAAAAGLKAGDLVTRVGDKDIDGAAALGAAVRSHQPGDTVGVTVLRGEETVRLDVTLGAADGAR